MNTILQNVARARLEDNLPLTHTEMAAYSQRWTVVELEECPVSLDGDDPIELTVHVLLSDYDPGYNPPCHLTADEPPRPASFETAQAFALTSRGWMPVDDDPEFHEWVESAQDQALGDRYDW